MHVHRHCCLFRHFLPPDNSFKSEPFLKPITKITKLNEEFLNTVWKQGHRYHFNAVWDDEGEDEVELARTKLLDKKQELKDCLRASKLELPTKWYNYVIPNCPAELHRISFLSGRRSLKTLLHISFSERALPYLGIALQLAPVFLR